MSSADAERFENLQLGDQFPDFDAKTQLGSINLHAYCTGSWCMLFTHPADFTPVCLTEIGMVSKLMPEFEARMIKVVGMSADSVERHKAFIKDVEETQECQVLFPIVADVDASISKRLGAWQPGSPGCDPAKAIIRAVYVIDPQRRLQLKLSYPVNLGRNFYEILRAVDALKLVSHFKVSTPANWKAGEDVMILPSINSETAEELFKEKGFQEIKPYLRITPSPNVD